MWSIALLENTVKVNEDIVGELHRTSRMGLGVIE